MNIETLRGRIRGTLITSFERDFDRTRAALLWNGRKPPARARVIVRAACAADVTEAVRFAAAHGLVVSPRGGGHHSSGVAARGDMVIDVSGLKDLRIDVDARNVQVGPGVTNQRLAQALYRHGLAFPVGHCGSVLVSGYLLGGGVGWNSASWGIACFSIVAADVVMPDGRLLRASVDQNAHLF